MALIIIKSSHKIGVSNTVVGKSDEQQSKFGNAKRDDILASDWIPFAGSIRHAVTLLSIQVS